MRHNVDGKKLGRTSSHRKAMFANMTASLIMHDRIETTLPKAKELRRIADKLVTLGKSQTLHARRRAIAITRCKPAVAKLFSELAERFTARNGGYTRIMKLGWRHGDAAPMAAIEYLPSESAIRKEEGGEHGKKEFRRAKEKVADKKGLKAKLEQTRAHKKSRAAAKNAPTVNKPAKRSSPTRRTAKGD